ncbi:NAD-dependent deacetylase [Wickerhamomyces ciferrii]|uniref:NAD-dependent protein deacylase n=1 Tax=Wickerhamomyces ciferrii (strain ATCC 14091 / BCRC 22168 / CBS 111 / JCM 3599 / NBRC 0793 / NRRL Y-1031 F-60-10) TaxID=1206466 RepID=K0KK02_WICCF|nr:NAD-dependent deacetylase [Wickerhamomyces ciferrii]CCH41774.1 NAD-dependent deacetylase [Wickerhamomyces ciferrii]
MEQGLNKTDSSNLESFHDYLLQANNILAVVGAGLSASSGLSTFRGAGGLWRNFSAIDLATPDAFHFDPGLVWQFYSARRFNALKAKPNKGHYALAELSNRKGGNFLTLTQNVDGLSTRAGHSSDHLLELHGSLFTLKCTNFFCNYVDKYNREHPLTPALAGSEDEIGKKRKAQDTSAEQQKKMAKPDDALQRTRSHTSTVSATSSPDIKPVDSIPEKDLPHCPECKEGLLRPGVVWFGESLPLKAVDQADEFLMNNKVDLVLVIGTSGNVWPAMGYVERVQKNGGKVAVFNTEIDNIDQIKKEHNWGFIGDASKWLPLALEPIIGSEFVPRDYKRR